MGSLWMQGRCFVALLVFLVHVKKQLHSGLYTLQHIAKDPNFGTQQAHLSPFYTFLAI